MMSDVCKHCCARLPSRSARPAPSSARSSDNRRHPVDVCNGCRDCIGACPFGVIDINPVSGTAQKCTLCYDRMRAGMTPACAQACPPIIFFDRAHSSRHQARPSSCSTAAALRLLLWLRIAKLIEPAHACAHAGVMPARMRS